MERKHTQNSIEVEKGVSIVEAIVVISIISVAFAAILSAAVFFLRGGLYATDQAQALFVLDESIEAIRFLRDNGYTTNITPLVDTGTYYLTNTALGWSATTTNTLALGKFTRSVEIQSVYRRISDDDIVPSTSGDPKAIDTGTVLVHVLVEWGKGSVEGTTYLTDLYEN